MFRARTDRKQNKMIKCVFCGVYFRDGHEVDEHIRSGVHANSLPLYDDDW